MKRLRILLADDHTLVRAGIRSLLNQIADVSVVAEAANGRQALQLAAVHVPDVAVLDIGMPLLNGLEATLRLHKRFPSVRVIILSVHANQEYVFRAFKAGAVGFLLKKSAVAELKAALCAVQSGTRYLSPTLAQRVSLQELLRGSSPKTPLEKLTPRQREILQLIAESRATKEIAFELQLSTKTVEFHRTELMKRLGIFDVPGLVRFAIHAGLTPSE